MGRADVINTYIANLNKYKHLLSLDEQINDNKKFREHVRKTCNYGDEKIIYLKSKQRKFKILFTYMLFLIYH